MHHLLDDFSVQFVQEVNPFAQTILVFGRHLFWYAFSDSSVSHRTFQAFKPQWLLYVPPGLTFKNYPFCPLIVFMSFVWI
jgi:hypothetical protein